MKICIEAPVTGARIPSFQNEFIPSKTVDGRNLGAKICLENLLSGCLRWCFLFCLLLIPFSLHAVNNYYVSPGGSGMACTQASPCTISQVETNIVLGTSGNCVAGSGWLTVNNAGACVHAASGTYTGNLSTTKNGTATAQIYYISDTRYGASIANGTWTLQGSYSNIEGFDFTGPTTLNAVTVLSGDHRGVDYNYIHNVGSAIPVGSFCSAGIINQTNLPADSDHFIGNIIRQWGRTDPGVACPNTYHGIYSDGARVVIENNIISGGTNGWGIQRQYQVGHGSPSDCLPGSISNNTIFNNQGGIIVNENSSGCFFSNWAMNNNIIILNGISGTCNGTCGGSAFGVDWWGFSGSGNAVNNNMVYGNFPADFANHGTACTPPSLTCPGTNTKTDASTSITFSNFQSDTRTSPASGYNVTNYELKLGSNAVLGGSTSCAASPGLSPCVPSTDLALIATSSPPSIGVFTFVTGPAVTFSPTSLSFGSHTVGTPTTLPTTLTNSGGSSLTISSIGITGTNAGDFSQTNNCGASLAAGAFCTINVTFTPAATGARTASVSVSDNATGSPHTVALSGTGTSAVVIGFTQVNSATPQSPSSSVAVSYPSAQTAGHLNVVAVGWNDTSSTVTSVSDSRGNTYTLAIGPTTGTGLRQSIYYAKNISAGANTVTVNFNQAAAFVDVRILEYSGLSATSPLDVTAGASGSGTSPSSGSATTTTANELIFGAGMTSTHYTGPGTGFTSRIITASDGDIAEDKTVSSTGSYSAAAVTTSSNWVMQMVAFKATP